MRNDLKAKSLARVFGRAVFTAILVTAALCPRAFAVYWTENSQATFGGGYYVLNRTTASADNMVKLNQVSDWYDPAWLLRRPITVDNSFSSQELINYQQEIIINTRDLIISGEMRQDMDDMRFTASDGKTPLNYYIATGSGTATRVIVKIPDVPAFQTGTIFMYFNNSSAATSLSSAKNTYDLAEDWETGSMSGLIWQTGGGAQFSVTTSSAYQGSYSARSGPILPGQNSYIQTTINLEMTACVTFYWSVSCQYIYDSMAFYIDGTIASAAQYDGNYGNNTLIDGETPWTMRVYNIPAGPHTLQWRFQRSPQGGTQGMELGRVDNINILKQASIPTSVVAGVDENYSQFYREGIYQSKVHDAIGQQAQVIFASWTALTNGNTTSISMAFRCSDSQFAENDASPAWSLAQINNSKPNIGTGRFIQYQATLDGDGTTTPYLVEVSIDYVSPPPAPADFTGLALSSTSIQWSWTDNSSGSYQEDGFRLFSSTGGAIATLLPDVTAYIENFLTPNLQSSRWVTVFNSSGTNTSASSTTYTYAAPPYDHSEVFQFLPSAPWFSYTPVPTGTDIFQSSFTFTSDLSTTTIEYYRVAFTTNPAYAITPADEVWIPSTTVGYVPLWNIPVTKKPEVYFRPLFNATSWYFCAQTYNHLDMPSGITTLGPYSFQGCPSPITDLTAVPSTDTEGSIVLTWTAPSADGTQVTNLTGGRYLVKALSGGIIYSDSLYNSATKSFTVSASTSVVAGQKQSFTVTGLAPGAYWGFAIKSADSDNNISLLSSNVIAATSTITSAAAITHILFVTLPQTTDVGTQTSGMTVQALDANDNPLKVTSNITLNLNSTSALRSFGQSGTWGLTSVTIPQGSSQATFQYKDTNSGTPTITVVESPSRGWSPACTQMETVFPGKAVTFTISDSGAGNVGTDQTITVSANDGYNASNVSRNYEGDIVVTCTVAGLTITPSTHAFTAGDNGQTSFTIGNKGNNSIAGPVTYTVQEVVTQGYRDVQNSMLVGNEGMIKSRNDSAQWYTQRYSSGAENGLYGLSSPDGVNFWAAGTAGRVIKSTDVGHTWNYYGPGFSETLYGVYFVDVSTGWAVGAGGNIVKSADGGVTWTANQNNSGNANKLNSVFFLNLSTGWAAGDSGTLLKTVDSGVNWQSLGLGSANLNKVYFYDTLTGFITANGGKIYKTSDGGSTWSPQTTPVTSNIYSVDFFSPTFGYAAGASNTILKTINGGSTWSLAVSTAATPDLYGISFVGSNSNMLTAVGTGGSILQTADGATWSNQIMSAVSAPFIWNALVITNPVVQTQFLVQGKTNPGLYVGALTSNSGTSSVNQIIVKRSAASTCSDDDITSVNVYRDNNGNGALDSGDTFVGGAPFLSGIATIPITLSPTNTLTFTGATTYLLIMPQVGLNSTGLGQTFGMELDFSDPNRFLNVNSGIPFAQNNLPFIMPAFPIIPSSCTVSIGVGNLSSSIPVTQGQINVFISSFTMTTDRATSPWRQLIVARNGINNRDSDIQSVQLYKSLNSYYDASATLISTAAFGTIVPGYAYVNMSPAQTINNATTSYYFLSVNISPTAAYYTDSSDARFWLSFNMTTNYFLLDAEGANGVQSSTPSFTSNQIRIQQALNTLTVVPAFTQPVSVDQSQVALLQTLKLSVQQAGAVVDITKVHVTEMGTASDSDVTSVLLYRDTNGSGNFNPATDALLGSGVISSGKGDIILNNPEIINAPLPGFATYFIAAAVYKRATVGDTIKLLVNSTDISLAGINVVSTPGGPINTAVAQVQYHFDHVNVTPTDLSPREARVNDTSVVMTRMKLWVYCTASLTSLTLNLTGTGSSSNIGAVKLYTNNDNGDVFLSTDTLIGSGAFSVNTGTCAITLTAPLEVNDSSSTVFVVYDLDPNGAPLQTVGLGVSNGAFTTSPTEPGYNFPDGISYFHTAPINLLRKETPSVPLLSLDIGYPSGKQMGGQTVYFSNQPSSIEFNWQAQALNGIAQAKYAIASYSVFSTTNVPDLSGWTATANTDALLQGLNLKHNTLYYLWVKVVSTDGFERVTCAPILIDLTPPLAPPKPNDTSPKAKSAAALAASNAPVSSYWVSWAPASDPESGVWYYELQERTDTSPVWHTVSTTTASEFNVIKDTATDGGKFFYYRVRAMNYAGSFGGFSDSSAAAYLSLPTDFVKDLASYPNPFDSRRKNATITFVLNQDATINFKIFDLFGRQVKGWQVSGAAGDNTSTWDGTDDGGRKVAAGMYILYAEIQGSSQTEKKRYKIGVIH